MENEKSIYIHITKIKFKGIEYEKFLKSSVHTNTTQRN